MENISVTHFDSDAVQDKKLESYDWGRDNFLAGQELTVTITLREYRELVTAKATADQNIAASRDKASKMEQELRKAQELADRLKAENYDLQNKVLAARDHAPDTTVADEEGSGEE